jgi:hypothetical protein
MWFRLILQPLVATLFGVRAGLANAKRPKHADRRSLFRQALHDVGKMLAVGVGMDVVFQLVALRTIYPGEALVVGFLLVALPYQGIRTVTGWLASRS